MEYCMNCGTVLEGQFCHKCGQKQFELKDRTLKSYLVHFFEEFFTFDTKVPRTLKYLFFKPGFLTEEFITGKVASYVTPLKLYLFVSLFTFFVNSYIEQDYYQIVSDEEWTLSNINEIKSSKHISDELFTERFNANMSGNLPVYTIIMVLVFCIPLKVIFVGRKIYFTEHFVFSMHFFSFVLILMTVHGLMMPILPYDAFYFAWLLLPAMYLFFAVKRVYNLKIFSSLLLTSVLTFYYIILFFAWYLALVFISALTT